MRTGADAAGCQHCTTPLLGDVPPDDDGICRAFVTAGDTDLLTDHGWTLHQADGYDDAVTCPHVQPGDVLPHEELGFWGSRTRGSG